MTKKQLIARKAKAKRDARALPIQDDLIGAPELNKAYEDYLRPPEVDEHFIANDHRDNFDRPYLDENERKTFADVNRQLDAELNAEISRLQDASMEGATRERLLAAAALAAEKRKADWHALLESFRDREPDAVTVDELRKELDNWTVRQKGPGRPKDHNLAHAAADVPRVESVLASLGWANGRRRKDTAVKFAAFRWEIGRFDENRQTTPQLALHNYIKRRGRKKSKGIRPPSRVKA